jgi:putative transposase
MDVSAQIWNHAVALHRRHYRIFKKNLPKAKLQAHLAKLRKGRYSHWQAVGSQSLQAIADRLYLAWLWLPAAAQRCKRSKSWRLKAEP